MTVQLAGVVLDATDPNLLATFWAHALGWSVREADHGAVDLEPADATSFGLRLRPGARPKEGQNRMHFDLTTTSADDQRDTVAELVAMGGGHIDIGQDGSETHVVLADPEGNELCIIEPTNRFLASCPRLGAVNCDGTKELGYFFHDALGWPLVWDHDEETAIQSPEGTGPKITWSGPPLMPRPARERFHLHLAPAPGTSTDAALDQLLALGATPLAVGPECPGAVAIADVDHNALCLVPA